MRTEQFVWRVSLDAHSHVLTESKYVNLNASAATTGQKHPGLILFSASDAPRSPVLRPSTAGNVVGDKGVKALAEALKANHVLTSLDISGMSSFVTWAVQVISSFRFLVPPVTQHGTQTAHCRLHTRDQSTSKRCIFGRGNRIVIFGVTIMSLSNLWSQLQCNTVAYSAPAKLAAAPVDNFFVVCLRTQLSQATLYPCAIGPGCSATTSCHWTAPAFYMGGSVRFEQSEEGGPQQPLCPLAPADGHCPHFSWLQLLAYGLPCDLLRGHTNFNVVFLDH